MGNPLVRCGPRRSKEVGLDQDPHVSAGFVFQNFTSHACTIKLPARHSGPDNAV